MVGCAAPKSAHRWRFPPEDVRAYLAGETPASVDERAAWDAYVRKVAAAAPPLRPEQIAALSALFDYQPDGGGVVRPLGKNEARPPDRETGPLVSPPPPPSRYGLQV